MLLPILLIIACSVFYWLGGIDRKEIKWAHTLFRDIGCSLCIVGLTWWLFGWSWPLLIAFGLCWGGLTIGDDVKGDKWYWSLHGFVVGLSMCAVSLWWGLLVASIVSGLTYLVSKFLNKNGVDIWLRGAIYGSMPLLLLKILPN